MDGSHDDPFGVEPIDSPCGPNAVSDSSRDGDGAAAVLCVVNEDIASSTRSAEHFTLPALRNLGSKLA